MADEKKPLNKAGIECIPADQIEVRASYPITGDYVRLLLYKDSRFDIEMLTKIFGATGWKNEYRRIGDSLWCTISVRDEKGNWISREDMGDQSNVSAKKGESSDALKRAAYRFGIGIELYTAKDCNIRVHRSKLTISTNGKYVDDSFDVEHIEYTNGEISAIQISATSPSGRKSIVFSWNAKGCDDGERVSLENITVSKTAFANIGRIALYMGVSYEDAIESLTAFYIKTVNEKAKARKNAIKTDKSAKTNTQSEAEPSIETNQAKKDINPRPKSPQGKKVSKDSAVEQKESQMGDTNSGKGSEANEIDDLGKVVLDFGGYSVKNQEAGKGPGPKTIDEIYNSSNREVLRLFVGMSPSAARKKQWEAVHKYLLLKGEVIS